MPSITALCNPIFEKAIEDYHLVNEIDQPIVNPYQEGSLSFLLYQKCWIDTAQWHMEDEVRHPEIAAEKALYWKRRIDAQNQIRTDMVEFIDGYFLNKYQDIKPIAQAKINTESPAWAIDRLSILALKIYHMQEETLRENASDAHIKNCEVKLQVLLTQRVDLSTSIDELITAIELGQKYMKVYKQMKMYNDPNMNPVLYQNKK